MTSGLRDSYIYPLRDTYEIPPNGFAELATSCEKSFSARCRLSACNKTLAACDIDALITALDRLVDSGNTVLVVEHNLEVIKMVDWVIDLGPEGGVCGGEVVAYGTPEDLSQVENSHTARYLRPVLQL